MPARQATAIDPDQPNSASPTLKAMLLDIFPASERIRLAFVLATAIVVALFEVVGVASILPFMAILLEPESIERFSWLRRILDFMGANDTNERILYCGLITGAVIIMSNAASAIGMWAQQWFVARTKIRVTTSLFDAFLRQPIAYHVEHDAPSLLKVIYMDADAAVRLIEGCLQFSARSFVIVALLAVLVLQNPQVAFWTLGVLGGSYFLIYRFVRGRQEILGTRQSTANSRRSQVAQETLGGIKELMVLGRTDVAKQRFAQATIDTSLARAANEVASLLPRYILEPVAFGGILAVALTLTLTRGVSASGMIPTLALYAFVGYRLLPALQTMYYAATQIRFAVPSIRNLHDHWQSTSAGTPEPRTSIAPASQDFNLDHRLQVRDLSFRYPDSLRPAVSHVTVDFERGESVGLVGSTGSGKTTFAELLLGLHSPASGSISIAGNVLNEEIVSEWRKHIGYVPQQVFLANASIAENIGFGLDPSALDLNAVYLAAEKAQATEFISGLPNGFETVVGERGVRLSGGQRQRLGIARALYNDPSVLVFDEATSALDGVTEDAVMQAVYSLKGKRTVIIIAHRIKTVEACDRIFVMDAGRIVASGPYQMLMETSELFKRLAGTSPSRTPMQHVS